MGLDEPIVVLEEDKMDHSTVVVWKYSAASGWELRGH